ncbi:hypothetical protein TNCV_3656291 [Trichonephila clavipes]|nr:hypothetical protein TNCV_3656291 [Trichonephila clavipes]
MRKIITRWVQDPLSEVQKWYLYALAGNHQARYLNEGDAFLKRIVAIDKTYICVRLCGTKAHVYCKTNSPSSRMTTLVVMSQTMSLTYYDGGSGKSWNTLITHLK